MIIITLNGSNEILRIENDIEYISSNELEKFETDSNHSNLFYKDFEQINR